MEPQKHTDYQTGKSSYLGPNGEKYSSYNAARDAVEQHRLNQEFLEKHPNRESLFELLPFLAPVLWFVAASTAAIILQYVVDSHHTYPQSSLSVAIVSIISFAFNPFSRILSLVMGSSFYELFLGHQFIMTVIINILSIIWLLIIGKILAPKLPLFRALFAKKSQPDNTIKVSFTKANIVLFSSVITYYILLLTLP